MSGLFVLVLIAFMFFFLEKSENNTEVCESCQDNNPDKDSPEDILGSSSSGGAFSEDDNSSEDIIAEDGSGGGGGGSSSSGGSGSSSSGGDTNPAPETEDVPEDINAQPCGYYYSEYGVCNGTCPNGKCIEDGRSCYCK